MRSTTKPNNKILHLGIIYIYKNECVFLSFCFFFRTKKKREMQNSSLAQRLERLAVNQKVEGSIPSRGAFLNIYTIQ